MLIESGEAQHYCCVKRIGALLFDQTRKASKQLSGKHIEGEEEIRKNFAVPKPIKMAQGDWKKFKTASDCHICGNGLVDEEVLDSLPVWQLDEGIDDYRYCGQSHKRCNYENKKTSLYEKKLKRVEEQADKEKAKKLKNVYSAESHYYRKTAETL